DLSPRGHWCRPEFQVGIAGGQSSEAWGVGPEAWSRGVELRSTGRPRAAVPTWALLEGRVLKPGAWGLKPGAEESSCARPDGRGRPSPRGHCWSPEFHVGIAGGQSSEA